MQFAKKHYSIREAYWIFYRGVRSMKHLIGARKRAELSPEFVERIMLAVTEVNGCGACSYAYTKIALGAGMSSAEIRNILAGVLDDVPDSEVAAVLFAQHYADTRGNPTAEAWDRLVDEYGKSAAEGILGAIRAIMVGNVHGIAWTALRGRLNGSPDPRSSVAYEVAMLLIVLAFLPMSVVHASISGVRGAPLVEFDRWAGDRVRGRAS